MPAPRAPPWPRCFALPVPLTSSSGTADGILRPSDERLNPAQRRLAQETNPEDLDDSLADGLRGADVFIGVSGPRLLDPLWILDMAEDPIVFALANPEPEVDVEAASRIATVVATGRSDYPNQINNVLAFPGFFRGLLDCGARDITPAMLLAAATALAACVGDDELNPAYVVPSVFNPAVAPAVAAAVVESVGRQ